MNIGTKQQQALDFAKKALKRYSKRGKLAKKVENKMWDVVLAGGCYNELNTITKEFIRSKTREGV